MHRPADALAVWRALTGKNLQLGYLPNTLGVLVLAQVRTGRQQ